MSGAATVPTEDGGKRVPFLAVAYPFAEYLEQLHGDFPKGTLRLLRAAQWTPGSVDGIALDAGEVLISERSEKLWGALRLSAKTPAARRAWVRRLLERLEGDGVVSTRPAHPSGPQTGPITGPPPTIVRFLKYRGIFWPASEAPAQGPAHQPAHGSGPILPVSPPDQPDTERERHAPAAPPPSPGVNEKRASKKEAPSREPSPEVAAVLEMARREYQETKGVPYLQATRRGERADLDAAEGLLRAAAGNLDEIAIRWRSGLVNNEWPRIDTLPDLAQHWARFAPTSNSKAPKTLRMLGAPGATTDWGTTLDDLGSDARPQPGDPNFNDPDAWPTYEAFLKRDGTPRAPAGELPLTDTDREIRERHRAGTESEKRKMGAPGHGSDFDEQPNWGKPPKKQCTVPASPHSAFRGGRRSLDDLPAVEFED